MSDSYQLMHILLKDLSFYQGKWQGTFEFIIQKNGIDSIGTVPFTYERTWRLQAFKYPTIVPEHDRELVRKVFYVKFKSLGEWMEEHFFKERQSHGARPTISSFDFDEELSEKEHLFATFKLENIRDTFFINIQLIDNIWVYKLHSKHHALENYKTFPTWEDAVYEKVIEKINNHPKYRMKFVLHAKKFKYK